MINLDERYKTIAETLGLSISDASPNDPYLGLKIQYPGSDVSVVFDEANCEKLLDFLNGIRLVRLALVGETLEKRVLKLEESVFNQTRPSLEELRMRAALIGISITQCEDVWYRDKYGCNRSQSGLHYLYRRPRFIVPGSQNKFYFMTNNAFEPKRNRRPGPQYIFRDDEYLMLVKWVEHDEEIYARLNEEYNVTK